MIDVSDEEESDNSENEIKIKKQKKKEKKESAKKSLNKLNKKHKNKKEESQSESEENSEENKNQKLIQKRLNHFSKPINQKNKLNLNYSDDPAFNIKKVNDLKKMYNKKCYISPGQVY